MDQPNTEHTKLPTNAESYIVSDHRRLELKPVQGPVHLLLRSAGSRLLIEFNRQMRWAEWIFVFLNHVSDVLEWTKRGRQGACS
jgi:hypothetical protein